MTSLPSLEEFRTSFVDEFERRADEIERTDRIPADLLKRAADIGAYRLTLPKEHGGFALPFLDYLPYLEVAASGPGSSRMLVHLTNGLWRPIAHFGTPEQRALIPSIASGDMVVAFALTEQHAGTGRDLKSRAIHDGSKWLISGEKHLITFADRADLFLLLAATDDRGSEDSLTAFLVPSTSPGLEIDASQTTMGIHGTGHAWLRYNDMSVPDAAVLGSVGQGLEVALSFLDYSRVSLAACMVGLAQRALNEAISFAKQRVTFGRRIADRQAIQIRIAEMQVDVAAGRALVRHAAERCAAEVPFTAHAAAAKLFCLDMVGRVTDHALRVHGGYGFTKQAPIERIYRDARGFWFEEGTAEVQQLVVARDAIAGPGL